jgi:Mg2+ and Co2+ transporter CorA
MNERQEHTADVLGKLTVLGTIVLPMNIICGMWGMNVKVPGQEIDNLNWFWCSKSSHGPFFLLVLSLTQYSNGRTICVCFCVCLDC